jgi:cellulose synthase/poly-beta-1,6-N-acetylglucosamine synthase-like glycosyltransferase
MPSASPTSSGSAERAEADPASATNAEEPMVLAVGLVLSILLQACFIGYVTLFGTILFPASDPTGVLAAASLVLTGMMLLSNGRWCVLLLLALLARWFHRRKSACDGPLPYVSIFVPCYNESGTIEATLHSLLEVDYPAYELLVVNDGSRDDTLERARRFEGRYGGCTVRVCDKPNGGKWSAHNLAFQRCRGELILLVDADSRLDPLALRRLVAHMADPEIDGVAGQVRVRNRTNLLTRLQGLEYLLANGAMRLGQGLFGAVLIVPGPIGLFRRSALEEVWMRHGSRRRNDGPGAVEGPFCDDTFAEDFDLSLAVLCQGRRIVYEPTAISYTKAPDAFFGLINQRYRWIRGNMQVLRKFFRRARTSPAVRSPRLLAWILATCAVDLFVVPAFYYLGVALFCMLVASGGSPLLLAGILATFLLIYGTAGSCFVHVHRDSQWLLAVLPLVSLYNGLVLNSAWIISVVDEWRGRAMRW